MGQSVQSLNAGITAAYVGTCNEDTWERRVRAGFNDPFGINITDTIYRRQKMTKDEMNKLYADMGIDASNCNECEAEARGCPRESMEREPGWTEATSSAADAKPDEPGVPNAPQPLKMGSVHSADSVAENIGALIGISTVLKSTK
ncbi:hypothetical protein VC83_05819 [Pseudogymnoascus destructans]|uniref:Uncharacterized protein n=2 Tax=Pseudogymnoascus destructans TaxID=655981 RepID=L8G8H3_PSED2|nr:uncharacterized protein VC83_05819 [Pseudogymnoascus destructans]ELR08943.1 hypothetical protein GMDG_03610 [Pseudogymnoascus destructans 20631-21]OAF57121.1 hypothetical protein VC83_05819 [Pseudogymnoascus destructans]